MTGPQTDKRSRLVKAAADLSHAYGLGNVALADVARSADVPLGNVYYYFKTKASLGEAVIMQRCEELCSLRETWDREATPQRRLKAFVGTTVDNRESLARAGCPVGSLCAELGKGEGSLADEVALPFRQLLVWIEAQFAMIDRSRDKGALAIHLLAALQGVSLLANCFRDPNLVMREARHLNAWIDAL